MYAVFPLLLALTAGKIADRIGPKWPLVFGSAGLAGGLAVPAFVPGLPALFFSPALIGIFWIFFHVSSHQLVGAQCVEWSSNTQSAPSTSPVELLSGMPR